LTLPRVRKHSELLLQTLEANGVCHIFGNPGTTEIPPVRLCEHREMLTRPHFFVRRMIENSPLLSCPAAHA